MTTTMKHATSVDLERPNNNVTGPTNFFGGANFDAVAP